MELWVRSQDKKSLKRINTEIYLRKDLNNYTKGDVFFIVSGGGKLGEYDTEERALEVLDEIQRLLQPTLFIKDEQESFIGKDGNIYKINVEGRKNSETQELSTYVYEMPKE